MFHLWPRNCFKFILIKIKRIAILVHCIYLYMWIRIYIIWEVIRAEWRCKCSWYSSGRTLTHMWAMLMPIISYSAYGQRYMDSAWIFRALEIAALLADACGCDGPACAILILLWSTFPAAGLKLESYSNCFFSPPQNLCVLVWYVALTV